MESRQLALPALTVALAGGAEGLGSWSRPSRVMHVPVHHRVSEHAGDPGLWLTPSGGSQIVEDPSRRATATPHGSMFSPRTRSLNRGRLRVHHGQNGGDRLSRRKHENANQNPQGSREKASQNRNLAPTQTG
jgi:hypothetical protein